MALSRTRSRPTTAGPRRPPPRRPDLTRLPPEDRRVPLPDYLLDLPAEEAARLIALSLLDRSAAAAARMADPSDPQALHDFRVATRRLVACLEAYRPEIDGSVSSRSRRRLRRLARVTTRSRDLEVHLTWDRQQEGDLTARQRVGLRWHIG